MEKQSDQETNAEAFLANELVPKLCPSRSNISKWFQTKPKVNQKISIESTACNHTFFEFLKIWSENPRVGSSILSLGTKLMKDIRRRFDILFSFEDLYTPAKGFLDISTSNVLCFDA